MVHDVCLQNLPVTLLVDRAGLVGNDGETHHGTFDISFLSCIPNLTFLSPKDGGELRAMIQYALSVKGPVAIRYPRGIAQDQNPGETIEIKTGQGEVLFEEGKDVLIIALGHMTEVGLQACKGLREKGIHATLINPRFIKPLDEYLILHHARKCKKIYTLEDHIKLGGFGSLVLNLLNDNKIGKNVKILALPDHFVEHGNIDQLHELYGLNSEKVVSEILHDFVREVGNKKVIFR